MHKNFGVKTFQAEDEIAAVTASIGASYAGAIGVTGTSGPGVALKSEAINLAVMVELPLVILDADDEMGTHRDALVREDAVRGRQLEQRHAARPERE